MAWRLFFAPLLSFFDAIELRAGSGPFSNIRPPLLPRTPSPFALNGRRGRLSPRSGISEPWGRLAVFRTPSGACRRPLAAFVLGSFLPSRSCSMSRLAFPKPLFFSLEWVPPTALKRPRHLPYVSMREGFFPPRMTAVKGRSASPVPPQISFFFPLPPGYNAAGFPFFSPRRGDFPPSLFLGVTSPSRSSTSPSDSSPPFPFFGAPEGISFTSYLTSFSWFNVNVPLTLRAPRWVFNEVLFFFSLLGRLFFFFLHLPFS